MILMSGETVRCKASGDEGLDMLCPICVEACSCSADTAKLTIHPNASLGKNIKNKKKSRGKAMNKNEKPAKHKAAASVLAKSKNAIGAFQKAENASSNLRRSADVDAKKPSVSKKRSGSLSHPAPDKKVKINGSSSGSGNSNDASSPVSSAPRKAALVPSARGAGGRSEETVLHQETDGSDGSSSEHTDNDLDAQYALSEYYFSDGESSAEEGDGSEALAEYYGYSSGSDVNLDSLFVTDDDGEEEADFYSNSTRNGPPARSARPSSTLMENSGGVLPSSQQPSVHFPNLEDQLIDELQQPGIHCDRSNQPLRPASGSTNGKEESLSEQLAKITPQILAAISLAAKSLSVRSGAGGAEHLGVHRSEGRAYRMYITTESSSDECECQNCGKDSRSMGAGVGCGVSIEELFDTSKLANILSTSPPQASRPQMAGCKSRHREQQRRVPLRAFYHRTRRSSVQYAMGGQNLANALRNQSLANCTLTPPPVVPDEMLLTVTGPSRRSGHHLDPPTETGYDWRQEGRLTDSAVYLMTTEADDESPLEEDLFETAAHQQRQGGGNGIFRLGNSDDDDCEQSSVQSGEQVQFIFDLDPEEGGPLYCPHPIQH